MALREEVELRKTFNKLSHFTATHIGKRGRATLLCSFTGPLEDLQCHTWVAPETSGVGNMVEDKLEARAK